MMASVPTKNPILIQKPLEGYHALILTIAHPLPAKDDALKIACQTIVAGLDQYNLERTGPLPKRSIFYAEKAKSKIQVANICQYSFNMESNIDPDILECIISSKPEFLTMLLAKAYECGARRAFVWGYKNSKLAEFFIDDGFLLCAEFPDLTENRIVQRFYKDLDYHIGSGEKNNITISKNVTYDSYEELNPYHSGLSPNKDSFAIFIHDAESQILKGGMFGKILRAEEKGIAHALIDCLWVDASYRTNGTQKKGKNLGTVLMREAESLFREQGAKYIQLATNGFQAPEFYRKMGFELAKSAPGYYALSDGHYDIFDCTKKL